MEKCGDKMMFCFVFGAFIISSSATNCSFPSAMDGTWLSSSHGTWVTNGTHIYGMDIKINGASSASVTTGPSGLNFTFSCRENHGDNLYAIESTSKYEVFSGTFITLYTCVDLREISSAKFVYYVAKIPDKNGNILTANKTYQGICDSSDYNASYAHHVILRNGSESDAFILCPSSMYGIYSYNDSCKDPMYNTTSVSVCTTRQEIVFNYNACSTPIMYSQEGILNCVYYITNGSVSYLTVYNSDSTTPDEINYYRFTCIIMEEYTNIVYLTAKAKECAASQNTTFVNTGQTMIWRPYGHGVFAAKSVKKDEYILQYQGQLISYKEGCQREKLYREKSAASFLFYFRYKEKTVCVDATNEKFSIGRMVKKGVGAMANARIGIVPLDGCPYLCMFAVRDISQGEEILYSYDVPGLPRRTAKDTQSASEGHAKDLSAFDGLVSTVTEAATNETYENDVQMSIRTELTESDRNEYEADVEDPNNQEFSSHESDVLSRCENKSEIEYSALQLPHSQHYLSLEEEEHVSGSESCASDFIPMEADLYYLQKSEQHINTKNDRKVIASSSNPTAASAKQPQKSMKVMKSKKHCGKRIWDKRHSCVFCGKLYPKLARHFEQKHKDELDVSKALSLPKKSTARKAIWRDLLNRGDYHYNKQVFKEGTGTLIPYKRPSIEADATNYIPCEHCFGFFLKMDLWRHAKNCTQRAKSLPNESKSRGHRHQAASALLLPVSSAVKENFKANILSSMANDTISFIARMDDTIVNFGEKMYAKCAKQPHQFLYVKQKMRELARFLLVARDTNPSIISLKDCINPPIFKNVIRAVRETCKFDGMDGTYGVPSLALKLGHSLKKCAGILKSQAIQAEDPVMKQKVLDFIELYTTEWNSEVSTFALQTLHSSMFNKPKRIPLAEDVRKLNQHLETKASLLHQSLEKSPDPIVWRELVEVVLAQVVLFNRRRGGETERMEISQYVEGLNSGKTMQEEVVLSLTPFEQKLARQLGRVEIRGKRGRRVPVILTQSHRKRIDCLNRCRNTVGVSEENKYVFARIGNALTPIRSSDVLRRYAGECNALQPELLTSTSLRKHISTISQILNLKENELDSLASFLGHDIRIHRQYYRLPEDTIQLAKVSKILLELESGNIQAYRGKSLDEIQIDNDDIIEDLQDDCSEEEEEEEAEKADFCEAIEVADKEQDLIWIAITVAIVVGLVILIIFIFVIIRCIRRIKQRKKDEEQSITEKSSVGESSTEKNERNEEQSSIDSGIGEPMITGRNEEEGYNIVNNVSDVYIDDSPLPSDRKIKSDSSKDHSESQGDKNQPKVSLTKTLISRENEERKRQRNGKNKKKRLRKLGIKKVNHNTGKSVVEVDETLEGEASESRSLNSDEEGCRIDGALIAPFTKQYKYKKHIDHILEEKKSLPKEDKEDEADNFSPSAATDIMVGAEENTNLIGTTEKSGTFDVSDVIQAKGSTNMHANAATGDMEERQDITHINGTQTVDNDETVAHNVTLNSDKVIPMEDSRKKEITFLHVKEKKRKDRKATMEVGDGSYDSCSTETDSGVGDDDETYIDLQLTKDQQEVIFNSFQDKHGNLKPVFERNEEGKIVRKSDGIIVFDPDTGKVRIRKQISNIFNIPRLKRNKKGRLIGGYHDDPFGPNKQTEVEAELAAFDDNTDNSSNSDKRSSSSRRTSSATSTRNPNKENIIRTKTVAFDVRNEMEIVPMDISELSELRRTGRRDITSAIRKTLRERLFRRRKKRGGSTPNDSPNGVPVIGKTKQAWINSDVNTVQENVNVGELHVINGKHVHLKPLVKMHVRHGPPWSSGTPLRASGRHGAHPFHRSIGVVSMDPKHLKMFQQGLQKDAKVLHSLNEQHTFNDKLTMRDKLHAKGDGQGRVAGDKKDQDYDRENTTRTMTFDNSLLDDTEESADIEGRMFTRTGRNSSRQYDDNRLRILLEELFRDKKYFDHLIETTDPNSDVLMMTKDIAEYGRGFLLERAEFWDEKEPIPPRPPLTPYGFSMSRAHTSLHGDLNSTATVTPDLRPHSIPPNIPGYVDPEDRSQSYKWNTKEKEYDEQNEKESSV